MERSIQAIFGVILILAEYNPCYCSFQADMGAAIEKFSSRGIRGITFPQEVEVLAHPYLQVCWELDYQRAQIMNYSDV